MSNVEVTTLQDYSHQEGFMTKQCVIFASNERVHEILRPHTYGEMYGVGYEETIAILVDAGITVVPVIGFASDGFNGETGHMSEWVEDAPGFHFDKRPIMDLDTLEDIVATGREGLQDIEDMDTDSDEEE